MVPDHTLPVVENVFSVRAWDKHLQSQEFSGTTGIFQPCFLENFTEICAQAGFELPMSFAYYSNTATVYHYHNQFYTRNF
jgi:hypothetical protein